MIRSGGTDLSAFGAARMAAQTVGVPDLATSTGETIFEPALPLQAAEQRRVQKRWPTCREVRHRA
ncbi:hypothetical protein Rhow_003253 [Rhodococcus wratislaviensis]|uniref:Uncharacterized protein n=1 Tax=Rhodococcus wratislaviensis TaxID=44752 RepID=A0A402BZ77_RHOWR|nr:hypothetical protein Rhow_003253 [Rhodococcus wratislaviensis]